MHWYFDRPQHHDHYNRLSTHFVRHYYGYRSSGTTISMGVRDWQERNRRIISNDFIDPQKELSERLREFGRFEQGWREFNTRNPTRTITPEEFLDKNRQKYPQILRSRETAKTEIQHETTAKRERNADWAPPKAPVLPEPIPAPSTDQPAKRKVTPDRKPNLPSNDKPVLREPRPAPVPRTKPDEAKDYHRQKWEETSPRKEPRPGNSTPVPKSGEKIQNQPRNNNPAPAPKSGGRIPQKNEKNQ